eukprot:2539296-Amphidinium_carterae.1
MFDQLFGGDSLADGKSKIVQLATMFFWSPFTDGLFFDCVVVDCQVIRVMGALFLTASLKAA